MPHIKFERRRAIYTDLPSRDKKIEENARTLKKAIQHFDDRLSVRYVKKTNEEQIYFLVVLGEIELLELPSDNDFFVSTIMLKLLKVVRRLQTDEAIEL